MESIAMLQSDIAWERHSAHEPRKPVLPVSQLRSIGVVASFSDYSEAPCLQGFLFSARPLTESCGPAQLYLKRSGDKTSQTRVCSCRLHSFKPPSSCSARGLKPCW